MGSPGVDFAHDEHRMAHRVGGRGHPVLGGCGVCGSSLGGGRAPSRRDGGAGAPLHAWGHVRALRRTGRLRSVAFLRPPAGRVGLLQRAVRAGRGPRAVRSAPRGDRRAGVRGDRLPHCQPVRPGVRARQTLSDRDAVRRGHDQRWRPIAVFLRIAGCRRSRAAADSWAP